MLRIARGAFAATFAIAVLGPAAASAVATAPGNDGPPPPSRAACAATHADRTVPPLRALDSRPGAPRVFAMQFKQELRHVVTIAAFRTTIECRIRDEVLPYLAKGRPNIVAFNEDVGLMAVAGGSRGASARALFGRGGLGCESLGQPCGALGALAAVMVAYAPQLVAYHARFPSLNGLAQGFVAATDTSVRTFIQAFSDLAKRYGIYILGSDDLPRFTESSDHGDVALFASPDVHNPRSAFIATAPEVYNTVFLWGPRDVRHDGPGALRNVVASNDKVPLTPIEQLLSLTPGPKTGAGAIANLRPYRVPGTRVRLGFATSLPAFTYGSPPPGTDPCTDTSLYYMRCLDRLGANVVIQDEANPGRWTGGDGDGIEKWQPLSWMGSTYRATSDASVRFAYNVTPMLVGNLADLPFDGQTAITQRGLRGGRCHYVGNADFLAGEDREINRGYAGKRPGFLAIARWVAPDASRARLRAIGARLAPGSRDPLENDYADTAVIADLPYPADRRRRGCRADGSPAELASRPKNLGPKPR